MMRHLEEVGMGYFGHLGLALKNAGLLLLVVVVLVVHGFLPFLFVRTASNILDGVRFPKGKK